MNKHLPRPTSERGQAIVLIVFGLLGMFALVALALDGGQALADRRQAQNAADSGAMAGALARVSSQDYQSAAFSRVSSNGYPNDGVRSTVKVENPPLSGDFSCANKPDDCHDYIRVTVTSYLKTWFASIIGVNTITSEVSAVAAAKKESKVPFYNGSALVSLSETICRAFYFTGSSTTTITGSGIFINSNCASSEPTSPQQAFYSSGNGQAWVPWINVVGSAYYRESDLHLQGPLATGVRPYEGIRDLYELPAPGCGAGGTVDATDPTVAWPGAYNGEFPPQGVSQLMPGIYCTDELKINSDLEGEGVLFLVRGGVRMNGNAGISLKAKTTGQFAGLLIYMPPSSHNPVFIDGNSGLELTGLILAPSSDITINGTGSSDRFNSQVIGNTISITGNSAMRINYRDEDNYDTTTPPIVRLVK